jgi:predicted amidohydrolase
MSDVAQRQNINLCGSIIIVEDQGCYYNRFLWVTPEGVQAQYDKRHLFRMAGEHEHYRAGTHRPTIVAGGHRLIPQICYDLRFPAFSRVNDGSEVLLYVANWPAARREQWLTLLKARAIENLCYVIAVNRVGMDGNQVAYCGDSCVIDFRGELVTNMGNTPGVDSIVLDILALNEYRESFPAHLDADQLKIVP